MAFKTILPGRGVEDERFHIWGINAMRQQLESNSIMITDPAGREIKVLEDSQALKIAAEADCTVHEVYMEALKTGIYPYRYVRNMETISIEEQQRLFVSRVAVVGAGGLGGNVILLLARMGIGHLVVADYDVFDETNLNRQALSSERALGKNKSEEAVSVVGAINPGVMVSAKAVKIDRSNAEHILDGSDVVVDALDNVTDRFILEGAALELGIPLVHGALAGLEGQVMTVFPQDPGLKQLYGNGGEDVDKPKRPEAVLGVPALTASFVATLQAMEVIKIILKRPHLLRNVMVHVDLETGDMNRFRFGPAA